MHREDFKSILHPINLYFQKDPSNPKSYTK